jgi:hypothetical protein
LIAKVWLFGVSTGSFVAADASRKAALADKKTESFIAASEV